MVFRVPTGERGAEVGEVDYRLARAGTVAAYRRGESSRSEVCDAHPELIRAANQVGTPIADECPICKLDQSDDEARSSTAGDMAHVTYVFGPRLPRHGRCITLRGELARLAKRPGRHTAYVVEVCRTCNWNHLIRRSNLAGPDDE